MGRHGARMVVRRRLRAILVPLVLYGLSAGVVGYFLHNAKTGHRGLEAKQILKIKIYEVSQDLDGAKVERADWDRRLALMRSDQIDRDLLEERAQLGQVGMLAAEARLELRDLRADGLEPLRQALDPLRSRQGGDEAADLVELAE